MTVNFDNSAQIYEESGLVQKAAGERLLSLLSIPPEADVLDLGCGSGGMTSRIAAATTGQVLGIDISECMVNEARERYMYKGNLRFLVKDVMELDYNNAFDRIFCNSAFQWFSEPETVITRCFTALREGGIIGIQAPATADYCPQFIYAMEKVRCDPSTGAIYKHYKNPWSLFDSADDYQTVLSHAGFIVELCRVVREKTMYMPGEVYGIFHSGAENGYLNQDYYDIPIDQNYIKTCRTIIQDAFSELTDGRGLIELVFTRAYMVARKPGPVL